MYMNDKVRQTEVRILKVGNFVGGGTGIDSDRQSPLDNVERTASRCSNGHNALNEFQPIFNLEEGSGRYSGLDVKPPG